MLAGIHSYRPAGAQVQIYGIESGGLATGRGSYRPIRASVASTYQMNDSDLWT